MTDDTLCARCALSGRTCCQGTRVFLTFGDIERIALLRPGENFVDFTGPDASDAEIAKPLDAAWSELLANARRPVLRRQADGSCHFLETATGCRLPSGVRPLICRLYPYEYDAVAVKGVNAHLCPAPERDNAPLLLALLGMNRGLAEEWRKMLYGEMRRAASAATSPIPGDASTT